MTRRTRNFLNLVSLASGVLLSAGPVSAARAEVLYRLSAEPYPHRDMLAMIERVVAHRPDRLLWGSNWPHPICPVPMPNDGDLVDLVPLWLPDEATRRLVLVDNPAALYGFGATPR